MGCAKDKYGRDGGSPTQFLPYYLNGLVPLSYQVNDANLAELRDKYMASILGGQNATGSPPAGWLGPEVDSPLEYWPKYLAIEAIESYAEAVPAAESADSGRWHRPHLFFSFLLFSSLFCCCCCVLSFSLLLSRSTLYQRSPNRACAPAVVSALVAHHRQMWKAVSTRSPAFNQSKWGAATSTLI